MEQKNGAVIRRLVGYRRYQRRRGCNPVGRTVCLGATVRECVPTVVQIGVEIQDGRKTPPSASDAVRRLLAHPATSADTKANLIALESNLDPVALLARLRELQAALAALSDGVTPRTHQRAGGIV